MATPLLSLQEIGLSFGGTPLLEGAELIVAPHDRIALVGRNGSGKSTLLKIAAGTVACDAGQRFVQPGATVHYLPQEPDLSAFQTTLAYVEAGLGPSDDPYRAPYLLEQLGLSGQEAPDSLSGGESRRAALARVLAPNPDVLLLDEPTNHLDLPAIEWLETELASLKSALVIISHDRTFLSSLTRKTVWLDRGQTRQLDQGFSGFEQWRDRVLDEEDLAQHKLDRKIVREEHWLRYGVTARRKRNVRRLGELHNLRKERARYIGVKGDVNISVARGKETGTIILDAKNLCKSFTDDRGQKQTLVSDFSLRVMRGDRVAIVGPNGAGKTTLINILTGQMAPDSGAVNQGANVQMALLDQTRTTLPPDTTLKDALTGGGTDMVLINNPSRHVIAYMKDFLFTPDQINTPLKALSGGERARVMLARALALPSNLLVLDEPTNDLDLETLDLLQETISDYPGTLILVSHDRDFLDRVATLSIIAEGDGTWTTYAGGYSDMVALRGSGVRAKTGQKRKPAQSRKPGAVSPEPVIETASNAATRKKKKLSFNQQHALKILPEKMAELEADMAKLENALADPDLYGSNPEKFNALSAKLQESQAAYEACETQWLELEILREDLATK